MLLDTNALLWVYVDSDRLGPQSRAAIVAASRVHYSAVSVLEIAIKHGLGRIELPGAGDFPGVFERSGLRALEFTAAHAAALLDDGLARHDPFDRMIAAQARIERMPLLTSDATLLGLGEPWIHDARR